MHSNELLSSMSLHADGAYLNALMSDVADVISVTDIGKVARSVLQIGCEENSGLVSQ